MYMKENALLFLQKNKNKGNQETKDYVNVKEYERNMKTSCAQNKNV